MWIDLTVQGQKLRVLAGNIHLLLPQTVAVDLIDQIVHPFCHAVIIAHKDPDLIPAALLRYHDQFIAVHLVEHIPKLEDAAGDGFF